MHHCVLHVKQVKRFCVSGISKDVSYSKLTVPRASIIETWSSQLENFEFRVLSLENRSRGSSREKQWACGLNDFSKIKLLKRAALSSIVKHWKHFFRVYDINRKQSFVHSSWSAVCGPVHDGLWSCPTLLGQWSFHLSMVPDPVLGPRSWVHRPDSTVLGPCCKNIIKK